MVKKKTAVSRAALRKKVGQNSKARGSSGSFFSRPMILVIVFIVGVFGYFGYIQTRNYFEKRDLENKQTEISRKLSDIGLLDRSKQHYSYKSCGATSVKLGEGQDYCTVGVRLVMDAAALSEKEMLLTTVQDMTDSGRPATSKGNDKYIDWAKMGKNCSVVLYGFSGEGDYTVDSSCYKKTNSQYFH